MFLALIISSLLIFGSNVQPQSLCDPYKWQITDVTRFATSLTSNAFGLSQGASQNMIKYSSSLINSSWIDMAGQTGAYWWSVLRVGSNYQTRDLTSYQFVQMRVFGASSIWTSFKFYFKACDGTSTCVSATKEAYRIVTRRDFERVSDTEIGSTFGPDYLVANIPFSSFSNNIDFSKIAEMGIVEILPVNKVMTIISIGFAAVIPPANCSSPSKNTSFVTVQDGTLFLGDYPLNFVSFNSPSLLRVADSMEQEDLIKTIALFANGSSAVTRPYILGTVGNNEMIYAPYTYSSWRLVNIDRMLDLANKYRVKLILPFIDYWEWEGGIPQFISLHGITGHGSNRSLFYHDETLIDSFKHFIGTIITRVNSISGIPYINDTSILAWELGNELLLSDNVLPPTAWIRDISNYIKTLDPNHLVMDGSYVNAEKGDSTIWTPAILQLPSIDIYSMHFYSSYGVSHYANRCKYGLQVTGIFRQNMIIGEYGLAASDHLQALVNDCQIDGIRKANTEFQASLLSSPKPQWSFRLAGTMIWSLRGRRKGQGFYGHSESNGYYSYHYPGFPANTSYMIPADAIAMVTFLSWKAYSITLNQTGTGIFYLDIIDRGQFFLSPLEPPTILFLDKTIVSSIPIITFTWFGSIGATYYSLERFCLSSSNEMDVILGVGNNTLKLYEHKDARFSESLVNIYNAVGGNFQQGCPFLRYSLTAMSENTTASNPFHVIVSLADNVTTTTTTTTTTTFTRSTVTKTSKSTIFKITTTSITKQSSTNVGFDSSQTDSFVTTATAVFSNDVSNSMSQFSQSSSILYVILGISTTVLIGLAVVFGLLLHQNRKMKMAKLMSKSIRPKQTSSNLPTKNSPSLSANDNDSNAAMIQMSISNPYHKK